MAVDRNNMRDQRIVEILEKVTVRAAVARALEMSGSGYAKNQVTLFLDSLVNDGFYVCRSQQSKDEQRQMPCSKCGTLHEELKSFQEEQEDLEDIERTLEDAGVSMIDANQNVNIMMAEHEGMPPRRVSFNRKRKS